MMESFIYARKLHYQSKYFFGLELAPTIKSARSLVQTAIDEAGVAQVPNAELLGVKAEATPQMLPSPASIAPANSANSTPTNREDSVPPKQERAQSMVPPSVNPGPAVPRLLLPAEWAMHPETPVPPHVSAAANTISVPISPQVIGHIRQLTDTNCLAGASIAVAQQHLTLPIMARCFPITFSRMIYSSLSITEEYEPDIEDQECELLWPGQSINGEGLGWVCLMGQAMIREYGKQYGYQGVKGVVPKPEALKPEGGAEQSPLPNIQTSTSHASTPQTHPVAVQR